MGIVKECRGTNETGGNYEGAEDSLNIRRQPTEQYKNIHTLSPTLNGNKGRPQRNCTLFKLNGGAWREREAVNVVI